MNHSFLISFCNNKVNINKHNIAYFGKLTVNTKNHNAIFHKVPLALPENLKGNGITGMCHHQGKVVLLLQRMPSTLVFLNEDLSVTDYWPLENMKGVHSILSKGEQICLAVTNQDKVMAVNNQQQTQQLWSKNTESDTIHLNSICLHNDKVYATAFGLKESSLWSSARSGSAFCLEGSDKSLQTTIENIWHPHSLFSYDGQLYCCDSSNQRIIGKDHVLLSDLPGYTRGLYINHEVIICGNSQGRLVSHSTGQKISNKSDAGQIAGTCGINVYFKATDQHIFINLQDTAHEIFDILPL